MLGDEAYYNIEIDRGFGNDPTGQVKHSLAA
jgi:hypothetical protein